MSNIRIVPILLFAVCLCSAAFGQYSSADKGIGVHGNVGLPQSSANFKQLFDNGFGFGLEFKKHLINKTKVVLSFSQTTFAEKQDELLNYYMETLQQNAVWRFPTTTVVTHDSPTMTSGGLTLQQFSVNLQQYVISGNLGIYATAGPGLYVYNYDDVEVKAKRHQNNTLTGVVTDRDVTLKDGGAKYCFALNVGAGVEVNVLHRVAVFAEGKYHVVRNTSELGGSYRDFIGAVAGLRYALQLK